MSTRDRSQATRRGGAALVAMDTESPVASLPLSRTHCLGLCPATRGLSTLASAPESGPSASPSPPDLDPLGWGSVLAVVITVAGPGPPPCGL